MSHFLKAMRDPSSVYALPQDVLADDGLTQQQKVQILQQWEYDARELQVAEEENMAAESESPTMLNRVLRALHTLKAKEVSH